jgi:hypothetical protein
MPVAPAIARDKRHQPGRAEQADLEIAISASQPVPCRERDGECEQDEIAGEHVRTLAAAEDRHFGGMLSRRFMEKSVPCGCGDQSVRDRDPE